MTRRKLNLILFRLMSISLIISIIMLVCLILPIYVPNEEFKEYQEYHRSTFGPILVINRIFGFKTSFYTQSYFSFEETIINVINFSYLIVILILLIVILYIISKKWQDYPTLASFIVNAVISMIVVYMVMNFVSLLNLGDSFANKFSMDSEGNTVYGRWIALYDETWVFYIFKTAAVASVLINTFAVGFSIMYSGKNCIIPEK